MNFLKKHKRKLILIFLSTVILTASFQWGGNAPGLRERDTIQAPAPTETIVLPEELTKERSEESEVAPEATPEPSMPLSEAPAEVIPTETASPSPTENLVYSLQNGMEIDPETGADIYQTTPIPEGKPVPIEPQDSVITNQTYTCTLSVCCDTILNNMDWLAPEKRELIPADGIIFPTSTVTFYDGESVFHLLLREMKKNGIHMEYASTPIYNSAYIEGIHNLYEFDCGELSGWMYRVNGWFPNYGCSRYRLKEHDVVEFIFTCDLGRDIGETL